MIAVHAGAGFHSPALEAAYKRDLAAACKAGAAALAGGDTLAAVTAAIAVLEASSYSNAGRGSNLSFSGRVECDASLMAGDGTFGAVAAAPGIEHPIEAAALLARESCQPLSHGRVRPMMLAGDRAREWALSRGLPAAGTAAEAAAMHVTEQAQRQWRKYRGIVDGGAAAATPGAAAASATTAVASGGGRSSGGSAVAAAGQPGRPAKRRRGAAAVQGQQQQQQHGEAGQRGTEEREQLEGCSDQLGCLYDTVGCVVLAPGGAVAAGVSSGGIALKTEGRVGEAAAFGAGCWAQAAAAGQQAAGQPQPGEAPPQWQPAVACSVTGVGEHVMRHLLARELCLAAAAPPPPAAPTAGAAAPAAAAGGTAAGAAPAAEREGDASLEAVAAQLLQRTMVRGPAPRDCGLLCLRALPLDDGQQQQQQQQQQALQPQLSGEASGTPQLLLSDRQSRSLQPPVRGSGGAAPARPGGTAEQRAGRQGRERAQGLPRRYGVEVAVAHSAQSMAFGHLSCAEAERGRGGGGRAAAPAVLVLRRGGAGGGPPAPDVQTYLHGATLHL